MKKAGELLGAFFDEELMRSAKGYTKFFSSWRRIAGDHLAAHSRIVELEKTVLVVEADHPGWIQLIQLKRSAILESIRQDFPELSITALSIRLRKDGVPPSPAPEKPTASAEPVFGERPDTEDGGTIRDPLAGISDESFRETLRRLERSIKKSSR